MPNLMPFRDYSEHEVINLFACNVVANKGTVVAPVRSWKDNGNGTEDMKNGPLQLSNTGPGALYSNSVTNNFELVGTVTTLIDPLLVLPEDIHGPAFGILLKDVREYDENGEKLMFNSRKAAEMDVVIKDIQAVPILARGVIYINDINTSFGPALPGDAVYLGTNGRLATGYTAGSPTPVVGKFLSKKDPTSGFTLVKINFN